MWWENDSEAVTPIVTVTMTVATKAEIDEEEKEEMEEAYRGSKKRRR